MPCLASMIPEILLLIKQIRPRTSQIYNLRTPIPVFLEPRALEAVEGVAYPLAAAHDTLVLVVAEAALVADAYDCSRAHVGVADRAFAIALVAESADGDAGSLTAHDQVGVMARHVRRYWFRFRW